MLFEKNIEMKKIVVLDGYTLNPGDLSWDKLKQSGDCVIYDRSTPEQVVERAANAEYLLINKISLNREIIAQLPALKYIGVLATGYNVVDIQAASDFKITVTNIPVYGTASVAQMVFAHILNLTQHVAEHAREVACGQWGKCPDFCFWNYPLVELWDRTIGIVGYGRIGRQTAQIARAFGMKVIAHDTYQGNVRDVEFVDL
jgi:glycerate dehydrogenase